MWIKICGITNEADAVNISNLGADALGFILSTDSPRRVDVRKAKKVTCALRSEEIMAKKKVSIVGVFVNEELERVLDATEELALDYIQLSGDEDTEYIRKIKTMLSKDIKIIKTIRIKDDTGLVGNTHREMQRLRRFADFILVDTFKKDLYGGTGKSFRWDITKDWGLELPIILSGGLNSENARQAINLVKPFGVDASSRLEIYPGKKDLEKVKKFIEIVRASRGGKIRGNIDGK
jgi:phosphoribosylanthranilate isomerase